MIPAPTLSPIPESVPMYGQLISLANDPRIRSEVFAPAFIRWLVACVAVCLLGALWESIRDPRP